MKKNFNFAVILVLAVAFAVACVPKKGGSSSRPMAKNQSQMMDIKIKDVASDDALVQQNELLQAGAVSGGLTVVRLMIDGKQMDVASVAPVVLARSGAGDAEAATVIRISKDKSSLLLFSRDPKSGKAKMANIDMDDLEGKPQFKFPVLKDGALKSANIAVTSVMKGS